MRVIFHIGAHKTGTTSLQDYLYNNSRYFNDEHGLLYPVVDSIGFARNHTDLTAGLLLEESRLGRMVTSRILKSKLANRFEFYDEYVHAIRQQLSEFKHVNTLVLSSEAFFDKADFFNWEKLWKDLGIASENVEFILYLRHPSEHYLSLIQQRLKYSSSFKHPSSVPFKNVIKSYSNLFQGRIQVRILEQVKDTVTDLLNIVNVSLDSALVQEPERKNESFSAEAMLLLQNYRSMFMPNSDNVVCPHGRKILDVVRQADNLIEGKEKPRLMPSVYNQILDDSSEDIAWLKSFIGQDDCQWSKASNNADSMEFSSSSRANLKVSDICFVDYERYNYLSLQALKNSIKQR